MKIQKERQNSVDENGRLKVQIECLYQLNNQPRVFGAPIEECIAKDNAPIPIVVSKSIAYLEKQGMWKVVCTKDSAHLETEGIFRVSGPKVEVDALKKLFEEGILVHPVT